jgi:dTDP-glucose 4,6-dehydratase
MVSLEPELNLLITGGAGFIGSNFVRELLKVETPYTRFTILDSLTYAGTLSNLTDVLGDERVNFEQHDICDAAQVNRIMSKIDDVVHFAAESHVDRSITGSNAFVQTNIVGTYTLLEAARAQNVRRFLQVSTDEVYGSIESGSWPETHPLQPNSPYSASKASADLLARSYNRTYGLDVVITRCSNNYGPNQFPEKLIPLFVTNCILGLKLPVYGSGENIRDWLHVSDHCQGILRALENGRSGEVYNIGGGTELSNIQITNIILEYFNLTKSSIEYVPDRLGHDMRYSVDCTKAINEIGYTPKVDFVSGISETIRWYEANPNWWKPLRNK